MAQRSIHNQTANPKPPDRRSRTLEPSHGINSSEYQPRESFTPIHLPSRLPGCSPPPARASTIPGSRAIRKRARVRAMRVSLQNNNRRSAEEVCKRDVRMGGEAKEPTGLWWPRVQVRGDLNVIVNTLVFCGVKLARKSGENQTLWRNRVAERPTWDLLRDAADRRWTNAIRSTMPPKSRRPCSRGYYAVKTTPRQKQSVPSSTVCSERNSV